MRKSGDTLLRQWQLLRLLPRYPHKITAGDLQKRLTGEGHNTTKRSVERDLQTLSEIFPISVDEREKPYGWSWLKSAPILDVPGLTVPQALTFALVQRFLAPLLPASLLSEIDPYFKTAERQLAALPKRRGIPSWGDKIRVVQPAQTLLPPKIKLDAQRAVYEALLHSRQLKIVYHKRGATEPVEYTVHPLGLVQRGPVFYLVCTLFHYQDVLLLTVHRILSAIALDDAASYPKGFDLDAYIASGAMDFGNGEKIRLEVLFTAEAAAHLDETSLSADQTVRPEREGWVKVTATVNDTSQLGWWLSAFGDGVEVLKPARLRESMAAMVIATAGLYSKKPR